MTAATEPTTLAAWVLACAEADEEKAWRACRSRPDLRAGVPDAWRPGVGVRDEVMGSMESVAGAKNTAAAEHIATWDPARALAVARMVRKLVALHEAGENADIHGEPLCVTCGFSQLYPCPTLTALARMYADRDGAERWVS